MFRNTSLMIVLTFSILTFLVVTEKPKTAPRSQRIKFYNDSSVSSAVALAEKRKYEKALRLLDQMPTRFRANPEWHYLKAKIKVAFQVEKLELTRQELLTSNNACCSFACCSFACCSLDSAVEAEQELSKAIELSKDYRYHELRAIARLMIGRQSEAIEDLHAAIKFESSSPNLQFLRSKIKFASE